MNYLVIDLEMCRVPKHYRNKAYHYATEIIQVGAVLLDEDYQTIATLSQYVHPEFGVVDGFITKLTGIHGGNVKHAPLLSDVLTHLIDWIGDREYQVLAWSENDFHQIKREVKSKNITDERILNFIEEARWIDYQHTFGERYHYDRAISLADALMSCEIEPEGRMHDGLCDAINTASMVRKLESNPDYQIIPIQLEDHADSAPLNFCMGDLFAGLELGASA